MPSCPPPRLNTEGLNAESGVAQHLLHSLFQSPVGEAVFKGVIFLSFLPPFDFLDLDPRPFNTHTPLPNHPPPHTHPTPNPNLTPLFSPLCIANLIFAEIPQSLKISMQLHKQEYSYTERGLHKYQIPGRLILRNPDNATHAIFCPPIFPPFVPPSVFSHPFTVTHVPSVQACVLGVNDDIVDLLDLENASAVMSDSVKEGVAVVTCLTFLSFLTFLAAIPIQERDPPSWCKEKRK